LNKHLVFIEAKAQKQLKKAHFLFSKILLNWRIGLCLGKVRLYPQAVMSFEDYSFSLL
jgi:hypothetical protein